MRSLFALLLAALFVVGGLVRSQTTVMEVYLQAFLVATLVLFAVYIGLVGGSHVRSAAQTMPRIVKFTVIVWAVAAGVVAYGMLLSLGGGWDNRTAIALASRNTPFALLPVFALTLRREREWHVAMWLFVGIGVVSALVDLSSVDAFDTRLTRLVSGEFHNVYHQYALIVAVLAVLLLPSSGAVRTGLLLVLPFLLWRTMLSLSRGPVVIAALAFLYAVVFSTQPRAGPLVKRGFIAVAVILLAWTPLQSLTRTRLADAYEVAFLARASYTDWAVSYRVAELRSALAYGGVMGEGWGASGDFSAALNYTNSAQAITTKSYVHNLFGFAWWKLGVVGGALVLSLIVYTVRSIKLSVDLGDRTGIIVGGVLVMWLLHGMFNMDFARSEVNLLVTAAIAYFVSRSFWGQAFFEREPLGPG